jgi:hypothetical protein
MARAVRDTLEDNPGYFGRLVVPLPERVRPRKRGGRGMRWRRSLEPPLRLKEIYFREGGFPETRLYKEWKLFVDADRLAVLAETEPDVFESVGEMILAFTHNDSTACRVLWLSDAHVLLCSGRNAEHNPFPFLPRYLWRCHIKTVFELYELSLHSLAADDHGDSTTPQVLRALHRIMALGDYIMDTYIAFAPGLPAHGIEDFLSRTRSPQTVRLLNASVDAETARAVVRHCNSNVVLEVSAGRWQARRSPRQWPTTSSRGR